MTIISLDLEANAWRSINDGVMGLLSSGGMMPFDGGLRFRGELSLENNGGYSSARRLVELEIRRIEFPGAQPRSADDQ